MSDGFRIGSIIRDLRKRRGLTQDELASRTDRSVDAISQIERDVNSPNVETLMRIASALDVSAASIFTALETSQGERQRWMSAAIVELEGLSDHDLQVAVRQLKAFQP